MFSSIHSNMGRTVAAAAFLMGTLVTGADATVIAQYTFAPGTVFDANAATANATNVAASATGVTPSTFGVVGWVSGQVTFSSTTSTAFMRGDRTPAIADIFEAPRYFTFSVSLTSGYNLDSLTFEYGATSSGSSVINYAYAAQIQIGDGAWTNLDVAQAAIDPATGYVKTGDYTALLTGLNYQNLDDTTVNFRILLADDATSSANNARISNVILNSTAVPEPGRLLLVGLGIVTLLLRRRR